MKYEIETTIIAIVLFFVIIYLFIRFWNFAKKVGVEAYQKEETGRGLLMFNAEVERRIEERLRGELTSFLKWYIDNTKYLKDVFTLNELVNEYLKSKG
jgi:hypothetical protein